MKIDRAPIPRLGLGEGALWDDERQLLRFLDIFAGKIMSHDPITGANESWDAGGHVGAMALTTGGGAMLANKDTIYALDFGSGCLQKIAGPVFDTGEVVINDGTADRNGRFLFGGCSVGFEDPRPIGGLFSLGHDRKIAKLDGGIHQSNSHCFSPDGKTLYCSDSFLHTMYAYDYDPASGQIENKRVFADTSDLGGVPDGSTVDKDGLVWVPLFRGGKVAAFRPDGKLERVLDVPSPLPASVAWGGARMDRLYVMTIMPDQFGWPADEISGYVYMIDGLGSQGMSEPRVANPCSGMDWD